MLVTEFRNASDRNASGHGQSLRLQQFSNLALDSAWASGLAQKPSLDPGELIRKAMRSEPAGLRDGAWRAHFNMLAEELEDGAKLNALGRTIAHAQLVRILRQRVAASRLWHRFPQILIDQVKAPVIILGQMRSGTTRLHRLLATDPLFCYTRTHETLSPLAQTPLRSITSAIAIQNFLNICNPQLRRIHPTSALAPEEEFGLHAFSFHGAMFEAQWNVTRFARFGEARELRPVYQEFRQLVQTLRWKRNERTAKIQLLKAPQFMQDLDAVLEAFPGARILWVRRNMRDVVASSASLVWNQQRLQSDAIDRLSVGREWLRKTNVREARAIAALNRHSTPVLEIDYDDMNDDWRAETRRIYNFLRHKLTKSTTRRMEKIMRGTDHQGHNYSAADFGLVQANPAL